MNADIRVFYKFEHKQKFVSTDMHCAAHPLAQIRRLCTISNANNRGFVYIIGIELIQLAKLWHLQLKQKQLSK